MAYAERLDELDAAEAAIWKATADLREAAVLLGGGNWKKLDVPGRPSGLYLPPIDKPLELASWVSLDEMKKLAEAYWSALAAVEAAWNALSPAEQRHTRAPGKPRLS
jgi:hypothetical protein